MRINFGLYYYLVTMSDFMINSLISSFNLKTHYDVVLLYGCEFNYLYKYQPRVIQVVELLQTTLGLETGKFVALHVRSHINDNSVFNPLHLKFPFQPMFECARMAAQSLINKLEMNISKVPIFFSTDHSSIRENAMENCDEDFVFSKSPIFYVDHTKFKGSKVDN